MALVSKPVYLLYLAEPANAMVKQPISGYNPDCPVENWNGSQPPLVEKPNNMRPSMPGKLPSSVVELPHPPLLVTVQDELGSIVHVPFCAKYIWSPSEFKSRYEACTVSGIRSAVAQLASG